MLGTSLGGHMVTNFLSAFDGQITAVAELNPALNLEWSMRQLRTKYLGILDKTFGIAFKIKMH